MSGTVLQVERLAYRYGKTEVFADVSFALQEGEIALLTGPTGRARPRCCAAWPAGTRRGRAAPSTSGSASTPRTARRGAS